MFLDDTAFSRLMADLPEKQIKGTKSGLPSRILNFGEKWIMAILAFDHLGRYTPFSLCSIFAITFPPFIGVLYNSAQEVFRDDLACCRVFANHRKEKTMFRAPLSSTFYTVLCGFFLIGTTMLLSDFDSGSCYGADVCEGDFDNSGSVDGSDLATFASEFGSTDCLPYSGYEVVNENFRFELWPNQTKTVEVSCPEGKKVLGGGWFLISGNIPAFAYSYPSLSGDGWTVKVVHHTTGLGSSEYYIEASAICANMP